MTLTRNHHLGIHPGVIPRDELVEIGLTARESRVPDWYIQEIVKSRRNITKHTADFLSRFFSTTPDFWLNLKRYYSSTPDIEP